MKYAVLSTLLLCLFASTQEAMATKAIANWDVVPFQCINHPFKLGVVAFHETGVDVAFQINGTDAGRIADPTWNDRTGVFEYWIEINPALYSDGPLTISAIAHPDGTGHTSRVLNTLTLYANSGDSLTSPLIKWVDATTGNDTTGDGSEAEPYQTIKQAVLAVGDGGTVYLKAGTTYTLSSINGASFTYWTTITAAPGLRADDVHVATYLADGSSTGRYNQSGIRWGSVSLFCDRAVGWGTLFYLNGARTWFDGSVLYDSNGRWANSQLFNSNGAQPYLTNCDIHDVTTGGGIFQRNVRFLDIGADIHRGANNLTSINVNIRNMDKGTTSAHPDFIQFYNPNAPVENIIIYNCKVYDMLAQGIFGAEGAGARDIAFVNLLMEKDPVDSFMTSQVSGLMDHVLLWHSTIVDQTFNFRDTTHLRNWDVRNCVFHTVSAGSAASLPNGSHISYAHTGALTWEQTEPLGVNATVGDPLFVGYGNDDYRLQTNSPAHATGTPLPGVPADIDGYHYDPTAPNRGAFSAANPGATIPSEDSVNLIQVIQDYDGANNLSLIRALFNGTAKGNYSIATSSNLLDWVQQDRHFANTEGDFDLAEIVEGAASTRFYQLILY
ncbi:MAG: hypothetical protein DRP64_05100 [Verrucomicrobia bacterium]|nr:MAG: hypothetical protein DRP64_05100 [Verrucomicrobiota bacterium]